MANRFLNNIRINDEYTLPENDGSAGQAIVTDGSGNLSFGSAVASSADSSESIHITVKNTSGAQITKGTPVYITGETGNSGKIEVAPADASDSAKMPAVGILESTLNNNAEGFCVQGGLLEGLSTVTIDGTSTTANDTVYIKAGGGLTMTKPTGTNFIQNIAKVARVHASNGSLVVSSILRTNDVPTPLYIDHANQRLGIREPSPSSELHISKDSEAPELRLSHIPGGGYGGGGKITIEGGAYDYVYGSINFENGGNRDAQIVYGAFNRTMLFRANERGIGEKGYYSFYDGTAKVAEITSSGIYGNVFYDLSNTAYYLDPASTGTALNAPLGSARVKDVFIGNAASSISNRIWFDTGSVYQPGLYFDASQPKFIINTLVQSIFHDGYHPNADTWTTARTITIGNTGKSVNGSANVSWSLSEIGAAASSHTHTWADISGETANSVNSWGGLRHETNDGYIDFGPANSSYAHIYTDRPSFYFNRQITVLGGSEINQNDIRAYTFYDKNNTLYYVNPANTTTSATFAGNVGIGTTSPGSKLDINNDVQIDTYSAGTTIAHNAGYIKLLSDAKTGWAPGDELGKIEFYSKDTSGIGARNAASIRAVNNQGNSSSTTTFEGELAFYTSLYNTAEAEAVRIDSAGNVGIGTTFPNQKLTIKGTDQYLAAEQTNYVWGGTNTIGVRMGTDAAAGVLDFRRWNGSATTHGTAAITQISSDGGWGLDFRVDTKTSNTFATTSRMFLSTSGEVGIGTTSPGQKLHVIGNVAADVYYDRMNTAYFFNGDASKDGVDLVTSSNYAINVLGTISGGHRKHGNLETPEMQWSVGGSTDLNWKKLCDIVVSDGSYSGWGAEIEITDFSGNYGGATYSNGELYNGALSITHWGGTANSPEVAYANIPYALRNNVRWYKIQESGKNRYQLQVKSTGNYQQLYIKVKPGIGNQVADIISYANDTNGATSGGTAYGSIQYGYFSHEFAGGIWTNDTRSIGWKNTWGSPYLSSYYGTITTSSAVYIGGPTGNGADVYCNNLRSNKVFDRGATAYYFEGGNTGDSIRVAGDVVAYYSSDKRLKDNIKPIENALDKVKAISGVTFEWNEKSHKTTGKKDVGVVAQEIEAVLPELVETRTNGYKAVDYQKLTAVLIESVKELTAKVEALENKQCNCK